MAPQVLVLSLPRTAIADSLQLLGYNKVYHMREVAKNNHQARWPVNLLDANHGGMHESNTEDLKSILSSYDALADFPASLFPEELLSAYPSAKKIPVLMRDEEEWFRSVKATLIHSHLAPDADKEAPMRLVSEKYHYYSWKDDFDKYGIAFYRSYLGRVRNLVAEEKLLVYKVQDGWRPLCEFLGKEVPEIPFPCTDAWRRYKEEHGLE